MRTANLYRTGSSLHVAAFNEALKDNLPVLAIDDSGNLLLADPQSSFRLRAWAFRAASMLWHRSERGVLSKRKDKGEGGRIGRKG